VSSSRATDRDSNNEAGPKVVDGVTAGMNLIQALQKLAGPTPPLSLSHSYLAIKSDDFVSRGVTDA
jgi:hypothetical protein